MRLALISDVHANVQALDAVLADVRSRVVDATYHLGDLVGYSSAPNEVIARIRAAGIAGVSGNYDSTVAAHYKHCGCRSENPRQEELAHQSFAWTLANTNDESRQFLASLPFRLDLRPFGGHESGPTIVLVHATPNNNLVYVTEDRSDEFLSRMAATAQLRAGDAICFGHTHKPWHRVVNGVHFVNTGSVGRPKDGNWKAGYAVLDVTADDIRVEFVRVAYDLAGTTAGIRTAGLPEEFVQFLETGGVA